MKKLLIKIPTRERGLSWLNDWLEKSTNDQTRFLVSLDNDDTNTLAEAKKINSEKVIFNVGERKTKIEAINRAIGDYINDFDFLLVGADDIQTVAGFDQIIIDAFGQTNKRVLWFSDGIRDDLITISCMTAEYYKKFWYVYHPAYNSLWCDNEFHEVAARDRQIERRPEKIFFHNHYSASKSKFDSLYAHNEKFFQSDKRTYIARKSKRFPI